MELGESHLNQVILISGNLALWVWPLFAILLWVGYRRTKPTVSKVRTIIFLPVIILALSIKRMASLSVNKLTLLSWASAVVIGTALGWLLTRNRTVRADHNHRLIGLPGSWATLFSLIIIFFSRYYFSSVFSADPALRNDLAYVVPSLVLMGFFLGFFTGRMAGHLYQYRKTEPSNLTSSPRAQRSGAKR